MRKIDGKLLVGAIEECDLPGLKIEALNMRVDTGAQTSSIHVDNIEEFEQDNELWVRFDIHPDIHNVSTIVQRQAKVKAQRHVKSSNATRQRRYVIDTKIKLGDAEWLIELTLTDRSAMSYLMLLGRQAMEGRLLVDPAQEYLLTKE
ncbi:ATP-dependent zinc protease [Alkalimarinus sediminis]|uniref:ATP-dependent zinc protease n=1 Tax=Alkalimarinus sediminis TaxID=1632866 RepID=A0A9E8HFF8_9ALTE|nr:ATP-dependent zinc protease [Alkalimarinus sediminis]UZW73663.1 ATP-dependent zinc protease [Alkalimarinus sediminis]